MASVPCGNFAFLADLDRELYKNLHAAEKNTRINYRESGRFIRDALERFISLVATETHMEHQVASRNNLGQKIAQLSAFLPNDTEVSFTMENGQTQNLPVYDYIRRCSNSCAHFDVRPTNPKISYANLILSLQMFHQELIRYYGTRVGHSAKAFDEDLMPIGDLVIYDSYIPSDSDRSNCRREFLGYTPEEDGERGLYSLVRLYDRNKTDGTFMVRNQKCFLEVSRQNPRSLPGMLNTMALTPQQSTDSDFYMIRYTFNREPHALETFDLQSLSMDQRIDLCKDIALCLNELHHSAVPVFHRLLSYESIFLAQFPDRWYPFIVKFDYAKIISNRPIETVIKNTINAKRLASGRGREKYLAPDWIAIEKDPSTADWEKVDVYSLGILMADILRGDFKGGVADPKTLTALGTPQWMLKLLKSMLTQLPARRCTMADVMNAMRSGEA